MAFSANLADLDFETLLRCPVCFELLRPPILLCKRGHHVCETCRLLLNNCPTCTAKLTKTRSFLAEDLIQKIDFIPIVQKPNTEAEKTCHKRTLSKNTNILRKTPWSEGNYKCPLEGCKDGTTVLGLCAFIPHIKKAHEHLYCEFSNTIATFNTEFKFQYKNQKHYQKAIHISNMGLFFLSILVFGDHNINCCLKFAATESVANKFEYEIVVSNTKQSFSFVDQVVSLTKDANWLLQRGRVLVIQAKDHSLFGEFNVNITIVKTIAKKGITSAKAKKRKNKKANRYEIC